MGEASLMGLVMVDSKSFSGFRRKFLISGLTVSIDV